MKEKHHLSWKNGEIEVDTLGCKMLPILILMERKSNPA